MPAPVYPLFVPAAAFGFSVVRTLLRADAGSYRDKVSTGLT
ncbi:hypothetical protein SAMN05892883_3149 [Jatrophihabitans sp. GAS493]|nr:hypothetical protein [Jatrophihabitans sp. GAS493]SOD73960.1 hypothetical protein SAMN05892883_3149 [Jatrophihabitans sp. GAS493]